MNRLAAAAALSAVAILATATGADAHTPAITPTCDGLTVKLTSYESAKVKVWIDGALLTDVTGRQSFNQAYPTDGDGFTYRVSIDDKGTQYDRDTGVVVVKGCPVPTSTVTVHPSPSTTTVTGPPVVVTETLPPSTSTVTGPPSTVTSTVPGPTVSVEETLPGTTVTTSGIGAATQVTVTKPGPTRTVVSPSKNLAYTGSDFRSPITWVALLVMAGIACYGWAFGLRKRGQYR